MIINVGGMGNVVAKERTFKTGSTGFSGCGKVVDKNGKRYQVNVNVIEIGSKDQSTSKNPLI